MQIAGGRFIHSAVNQKSQAALAALHAFQFAISAGHRIGNRRSGDQYIAIERAGRRGLMQ
jgi:hypothetical protein